MKTGGDREEQGREEKGEKVLKRNKEGESPHASLLSPFKHHCIPFLYISSHYCNLYLTCALLSFVSHSPSLSLCSSVPLFPSSVLVCSLSPWLATADSLLQGSTIPPHVPLPLQTALVLSGRWLSTPRVASLLLTLRLRLPARTFYSLFFNLFFHWLCHFNTSLCLRVYTVSDTLFLFPHILVLLL